MKKEGPEKRKSRKSPANAGKMETSLHREGAPADAKALPGRLGTLYLVATPIGNLEDITLRAIRVLKEVALIAAEDTRHAGALLQRYGITTPLTSLYDQIERRKSRVIIERLLNGDDVACISDAGTPGVSDPGFVLVREAVSIGIKISPIPGASALLSSICVSGLPMDVFVFMGFLPSRPSQRVKALREAAMEQKTAILYESPKRLVDLLKDIADVWGNRQVVIARELTKVHEEFIRGSVRDALSRIQGRDIKGEITLVVAGSSKEPVAISDEAILKRAKELFEGEKSFTVKDVVDCIVSETRASRRRVYQLLLS